MKKLKVELASIKFWIVRLLVLQTNIIIKIYMTSNHLLFRARVDLGLAR